MFTKLPTRTDSSTTCYSSCLMYKITFSDFSVKHTAETSTVRESQRWPATALLQAT